MLWLRLETGTGESGPGPSRLQIPNSEGCYNYIANYRPDVSNFARTQICNHKVQIKEGDTIMAFFFERQALRTPEQLQNRKAHDMQECYLTYKT